MKTKLLPLSLLILTVSACTPRQSVQVDDTPLPQAGEYLAPGNPLPQDYQVSTNSVSSATATTAATAVATTALPARSPVLDKSRTVSEDIYTAAYNPNPEVVRYDRYTLVSDAPNGGQKYLLEQIVNIDMLGKRKNYSLNVEQGVWNTLANTGYALCSFRSQEVDTLLRLPLPKVHYQFGPIMLRDALQMIAGEAYQLTVNDAKREVCYSHRGNIPTPAAPKVQIKATSPEDEVEYFELIEGR